MNNLVTSLFPQSNDPSLRAHGMITYGSNDPEILMDRCAENLIEKLAPFEDEESFLVQSRGMASWLKTATC